MKRITLIVICLCLVTFLVSCDDKNSASENENQLENKLIENTVEEKELTYDLIGLKSITVNGEIFSTFCSANKEDGMWATPGAARGYTDHDGNKYTTYALGGCFVVYESHMYHGFDLLENNILTVEELELLEYPFWIVEE